ncbi:MAG: M61 family peptidase [Bacteroidia bacterium]
MKYIISYSSPHRHYVDIEFIAGNISQDEAVVQLPAWRPGRYELGNFAKNVQKWAAFDEKGEALLFRKTAKDTWLVQTKGVSTLHIRYNYYAAEINAGSTYLDSIQLYMNPVNCCVYLPERMNEPCQLILNLPDDYKVACGLKVSPENSERMRTYEASGFHELADSPFIASNSLQHNKFVCSGIEFNLWFQGECKPDWAKLLNDFIRFINEQLLVVKQFPDKVYHFIFQILPYKMYHGVEHTNSTVIALGPGYNLMKGKLYEDLLGVSSHELFHAWNIKTIRPAEMMPYDYTRENYSRLGYVCEGVTTYYGDYILFRSQVFNEQQYFATLEERLQKHFDNFGRFNLSVADSSFDTWLDGYAPGIPNRKTSIYDEGNLLAFATDIFIRKHSQNEYSLDDVMNYLYTEFALKGKGYSDADYKGVVEHFANTSFDAIFNNYINKAADYTSLLQEALMFIGCELSFSPPSKFHEHAIGIKVVEVNGVCKIAAVYPESVADKAGLSVHDDILSINAMQVKPDATGTNFNEWCAYFGNTPLVLTVATMGKTRQVEIKPFPHAYYKVVQVKKQNTATEEQRVNFKKWSNNNF